MPLDLVDPQSGMDYFQAATLLAQAAENNVDIKDLAPIPFWENFFPAAAHAPRGLFGCEGKMNRANVTATQAVAVTLLFCSRTKPTAAEGQEMMILVEERLRLKAGGGER